MAWIVKTTGEKIKVEPINGTDFKLAEMYEHVKTDIVEFLFLGRDILAIFCEEGKMREKEPNVEATLLALEFGWIPIPGDLLVGDVLFCQRDQVR